jgi:hypothetical protein
LRRPELLWVTELFFVRGSLVATEYGGAPAIQFNEMQSGSLNPELPLAGDVELIQNAAGIGLFHYGPRLWMLGNIVPLENLLEASSRDAEIERILQLYPTVQLSADEAFYRVRKQPGLPAEPLEYDSPPDSCLGSGRFDGPGAPVLYGSQDLEVCVHESRFAAGDELYAATSRLLRPLNLLDLSAILREDGVTEFESLDLAVLMLFLASAKAYDTTRALALAVKNAGYDGLIYPSYFSVLRTGSVPFETVYGLSLRSLEGTEDYERSKIIGNIALFGRPVADESVEVANINRLTIRKVSYELGFGPVTF